MEPRAAKQTDPSTCQQYPHYEQMLSEKTPTGVGSLPSSTSSRTLKGTRQSIVLDSIVLDNVPVLVELHHLVHLLPPEEGGQLVSRDTAPGLLTVQLSR